MKHFLAAFLLGALLINMTSKAETTDSGGLREWKISDVPLRVEGRFARASDGALRLGFPGITLHLVFRGSHLILRLRASSDEVYFNVLVDQGALTRLRAHEGEGSYTIFAGEGSVVHVVEIVRRSESWQGTCEILGFSSAAGDRFLPAATAPARRLLFIGDSITCGSSVDTRPDDPLNGKTHDGSHTSNASATYAKILAKRLKADCHLVSYGGRGLIRDWQGTRDTANAPQFYELALPDDPTSKWNHSSYIPDAIGICLGTNDFSQGIPDQNEFVNAYVQFVEKIRRDAPEAYIWLIQSPILKDEPGKAPKRLALASYLQEIVHRLQDARVAFASLPHYAGVPNDGHPTAADHVAMADELEPMFRQSLRW